MAVIRKITVQGTEYELEDYALTQLIQNLFAGTLSTDNPTVPGEMYWVPNTSDKTEFDRIKVLTIVHYMGTVASREALNQIDTSSFVGGELYFIPNSDSNLTEEWVWTDSGWEMLGIIKQDIDITGKISRVSDFSTYVPESADEIVQYIGTTGATGNTDKVKGYFYRGITSNNVTTWTRIDVQPVNPALVQVSEDSNLFPSAANLLENEGYVIHNGTLFKFSKTALNGTNVIPTSSGAIDSTTPDLWLKFAQDLDYSKFQSVWNALFACIGADFSYRIKYPNALVKLGSSSSTYIFDETGTKAVASVENTGGLNTTPHHRQGLNINTAITATDATSSNSITLPVGAYSEVSDTLTGYVSNLKTNGFYLLNGRNLVFAPNANEGSMTDGTFINPSTIKVYASDAEVEAGTVTKYVVTGIVEHTFGNSGYQKGDMVTVGVLQASSYGIKVDNSVILSNTNNYAPVSHYVELISGSTTEYKLVIVQ